MPRALPLTVLVVLGAAAPAQQGQQPAAARGIHPITSSMRDAGTYHVATDTWTRKASHASLGADIIYNNTCTPTSFAALGDNSIIDEGRIPSPTGPSNANARPGCSTQYVVDGFQISYCTDQPSMGTYTVNFYESYAACSSAIGAVPTAGFALNGLPAAGGGGVTCWIVNIDLDSPPQSQSLAFVMLADGTGTFQGLPTASLFGWEMHSSLGASAALTGPVVAGDFSICSGFDGTRWDPNPTFGEGGTGMSTQNLFRVEGGSTTPGCYVIPTAPVSSFYLELFSDACTGTSSTNFCAGDGSGALCPCGNHGPPGSSDGCLNSLGLGGRLRAGGTPSILNDTVVLYGSQMTNSSCLYFQGTLRQNGGAGTPFGDGKRCAGGSIQRIGTVTNSGGASHYPRPGDPPVSVQGLVGFGGTRTYQIWYRNAAAFCTPATFNLTNGVEFTWGP